MKALVYLGKSQLDYRDAADPELASGDVLVKVHACGICGSDMHGFHGDDPRRVPPMIMGHEATGVVQTGEWRGRAVAINPFLSCGECNACLSGSPQLCDKQKNLGLPPHAGGFADYVAVPRRNLVEIPEGMDFTTAALTEPLAVAYHAVGIGQRLIGKPFTSARIAVLGGGAIGLLTALVLISQGALEVLLSEPNEGRRRTAAAASDRISPYAPGDEPAAESVDLIFDAVGAKATREAAFRLARRGAVIIHSGLMPGSEGVDVRRLTLRELTFAGAYCYSMPEFRQSIELLASGALGALNWVEQRPMSEGFAAFQDIDAGCTSAAKIILMN